MRTSRPRPPRAPKAPQPGPSLARWHDARHLVPGPAAPDQPQQAGRGPGSVHPKPTVFPLGHNPLSVSSLMWPVSRNDHCTWGGDKSLSPRRHPLLSLQPWLCQSPSRQSGDGAAETPKPSHSPCGGQGTDCAAPRATPPPPHQQRATRRSRRGPSVTVFTEHAGWVGAAAVIVNWRRQAADWNF